MSTDVGARHHSHAEAVRAAVTAHTGVSDRLLRTAVSARAAGGPPTDEPYDSLARQIGAASSRVTDAEVDAVKQATGSDKATFEIVMSACIGAGLTRWDAATRAIEETPDAPA